MTVLCWILNHKPWKQYMQHRVQEIRRLSKGGIWRFCPGQLNPAVLPSRGMSGKNLLENSLWWSGPGFLHQPDDRWPHNPILTDDNVWEELVAHPTPTTFAMSTLHGQSQTVNISKIIDCKRFNNFNVLLRVPAYVPVRNTRGV